MWKKNQVNRLIQIAEYSVTEYQVQYLEVTFSNVFRDPESIFLKDQYQIPGQMSNWIPGKICTRILPHFTLFYA